MKIIPWIYAVIGNLYFVMYITCNETVEKYAVGPFWLLMILAPVVLSMLVLLPIARRLGLFGK